MCFFLGARDTIPDVVLLKVDRRWIRVETRLTAKRFFDGHKFVVQFHKTRPLISRAVPTGSHDGVNGTRGVGRRLQHAARLQIAHDFLVRHALVRLLGVGEDLPEADAKGPDVGRRRVAIKDDALQRHPANGDGVVVGARVVVLLPVDPLRQTKIGDLDRDASAAAGRPVGADQAVASGQIAMDETSLREVDHSIGYLPAHAGQVGRREFDVPDDVAGRRQRRRLWHGDVIRRATGAQVLPQVAQLHKLEQETHGLADSADAQQPDDVGVVQLGQETRLLFKIGAHFIVGFFLQRFHGHDRARFPLGQVRSFRLKKKNEIQGDVNGRAESRAD